MDLFLDTVFSFPTLVYSFALLVLFGLLLVSAIGLMDVDALDIDIGEGAPDSVGGLLSRLGLDGVPLLVVLTLLTFIAWIITYFVHLYVLAPLPDLLRWTLGAVVIVATLVPAVLLTSTILRPIRRKLLEWQPQAIESLLGKTATVRTPAVTASEGMADLDDGGAGLILQVRTRDSDAIERGDQVVLVEHVADSNIWYVVPEHRHASL